MQPKHKTYEKCTHTQQPLLKIKYNAAHKPKVLDAAIITINLAFLCAAFKILKHECLCIYKCIIIINVRIYAYISVVDFVSTNKIDMNFCIILYHINMYVSVIVN